jgi:hypothetical protein
MLGLGPAPAPAPVSAERLRAEIAYALADFDACRYGSLAHRVPWLIRVGHALIADGDIPQHHMLLAKVDLLTTRVLIKLNDQQFGWMAADRARIIADISGDALTAAKPHATSYPRLKSGLARLSPVHRPDRRRRSRPVQRVNVHAAPNAACSSNQPPTPPPVATTGPACANSPTTPPRSPPNSVVASGCPAMAAASAGLPCNSTVSPQRTPSAIPPQPSPPPAPSHRHTCRP